MAASESWLMDTTRFAAGQVIFEEGSVGRVMYVLVSGVVELSKITGNGKTLLKTVDQKNDLFGEMSLIDDQPRSATASALQDCELYVINETNFENLIKSNGGFAFKVIQILSERIRQANKQIGELSDTDQRERLLRAMVDFAHQSGEKIYNGGMKVNIGELQTWINSHLGISLKDVELQLNRLIKMNITPLAATSAKTREHIVLSPEFMLQNDRRRQDRSVVQPNQ
jgi:CRP/FNR family cyclic AMP-dependent transcriptional regulator